MSFFGKFKGGTTSSQTTTVAPAKKDPNAPQPTPLEKHLKDVSGPVRTDGSDKFFGFENYGSTCYSNSIIQCLYYSAPFRSHVINFPPNDYTSTINASPDGGPFVPRSTSTIPWPNPLSPARKQPPAPGSPQAQGKPEETKDSPEYRKRMALQSGPVLDMVHDNSNRYGMDESLFTALKDIFDSVIGNQSRIGVVSPHKFLEILRRENEMFRSAMHQDAHEFLNLLLNQVVDNVELFSKQHPALNGMQANGGAPEKALEAPEHASTEAPVANGLDTHWVHDLFEGLLTSETRCLTCENTSQRDEPFLDLSVDLAAHTSVTSCLRKFSEEEMLCERNKFHCDNCGGLQEAEKRMKIKRLPRVLALHLKRFKYTEDLQRLQKLFHRVVYPFHLRLFNTTEDAEDPDRLYELYAVVVHIGGGPYHGHYVSIIKTQDRGWLLFDDELVEPVDKSYVLNFFGGEPIPGLQDAKQLACAYILFYQETTLEAILKEQEMEGQQPTPTRMSAEADGLNTSPTKNGLYHTQTVTTPVVEEMEHMENLAHAATAPSIPVAAAAAAAGAAVASTTPQTPLQPVTPATPATPLEPAKSKKERKAEEKERKKAAKAAEVALDEKRREASKKRMEAWKKADDELKAAIEASRVSAVEEAQQRGDKDLKKEKESGLARFRHGSMSLRGKPKFLGGGQRDSAPPAMPTAPSAVSATPMKNGTTNLAEKLAPVPQEKEVGEGAENTAPDSTTTATNNTATATDGAAAGLSRTKTAPARTLIQTEEKKRNRFSLGRKKSQAMS